MRIIDSHLHLGPCRVFDAEVRADELVRTLEGNDVALGLVMPFPGADDAAAVHDDIAELGRSTGRVRGIRPGLTVELLNRTTGRPSMVPVRSGEAASANPITAVAVP